MIQGVKKTWELDGAPLELFLHSSRLIWQNNIWINFKVTKYADHIMECTKSLGDFNVSQLLHV